MWILISAWKQINSREFLDDSGLAGVHNELQSPGHFSPMFVFHGRDGFCAVPFFSWFWGQMISWTARRLSHRGRGRPRHNVGRASVELAKYRPRARRASIPKIVEFLVVRVTQAQLVS